MAGASKKSKKSTVVKKASTGGTAGTTKGRGPRVATKAAPSAPTLAPPAAAADALDPSAPRSSRLMEIAKKPTIVHDKKVLRESDSETATTVSSLAESGGEESDFEMEPTTKAAKKKKKSEGKVARPKAAKALKAEASKPSHTAKRTKAKATKAAAAAATKPRAQKKPRRGGKRGHKSVLEDEYAAPSPTKIRAKTAPAWDDDSDVDSTAAPAAALDQLFPDSPKTEDWRLAAAMDY